MYIYKMDDIRRYTIENNRYVNIIDKKGNTVPYGEITDEKLGEKQIIIQLGLDRQPILGEFNDTIPIGLAGYEDGRFQCHFKKGNTQLIVEENLVTCMTRENGKSDKTCHCYAPEELPLDLKDYPIKLYRDSGLVSKVMDSMKEKGKFLPLAKEIFKYVIDGKASSTEIKDFEKKVNEMRLGNAEEKLLFLYFRNHLIEKGLMPIDKEGKAIDLSLMYIPEFNVNEFLEKVIQEKPQMLEDAMTFYQMNRNNRKEITLEDMLYCMNQMKTEHPGIFAELHNYLLENQFIQESPMRTKINLNAEQITYLRGLEHPSCVYYVVEYVNKRLNKLAKETTGRNIKGDLRTQDKAWIKKATPLINRYIASMRFGTVDEQGDYYNFCKIIPDLEKIGKQTYTERRKQMLTAPQRAKDTIENKV